MRLGFGEIVIVLVIALLVFGPTKLPQLGDALGKGIRNFKKAATEGDDEPAQPAQVQASLPAPTPGAAQAEPSKARERA